MHDHDLENGSYVPDWTIPVLEDINEFFNANGNTMSAIVLAYALEIIKYELGLYSHSNQSIETKWPMHS